MPYKNPNSDVAKKSQARRGRRYREAHPGLRQIQHSRTKERDNRLNRDNYYRNHETLKRKHLVYARDHKEEFRNQKLLSLYGITWADKVQMYRDQNGLCKCCEQPLPPVTDRLTHTEHNHNTGQVRGLVHSRCNRIIGILENTPCLVLRAQEYLRLTKDQPPVVASSNPPAAQ